MNPQSSRSHAIIAFKLTKIEILDPKTGFSTTSTSVVNIVDLAGSEVSDSSQTTGGTLKEGAMINNSLTVLGRIINQLAELEDRF